MPISQNQPKKQGQERGVSKGVGQKEIRNIWKGVGSPRGPHKICGLGPCMLLMND